MYKQLLLMESMRLLHLGVVQDRPGSVLVAFLSNTCNISDDQPGTKIKFTQNIKYHIREGFTKKVAVLLDFVQMTPLQGEQGDENVCVLCKVIIFSHGFQAGP